MMQQLMPDDVAWSTRPSGKLEALSKEEMSGAIGASAGCQPRQGREGAGGEISGRYQRQGSW